MPSTTEPSSLQCYDTTKSYSWNYDHPPDIVEIDVAGVPGNWTFCGLPVNSPLGMPAGPLLNGRWCLYYASLGFDVVTYKTVRSVERGCYELPNLQAVTCGQLDGSENDLPMATDMKGGSWAVSFGMPSKSPDVWRADVEQTRQQLRKGQLLSVSVVGTVQEGWSDEDLARDYAHCARWAVESGADAIETNFSCPNVATQDGQIFQQPTVAAIVTEAVREAVGKTPYIIKIGHLPHFDQARQLVDAVAPFVDALAMTNSVATTVVDDHGKRLFDGAPRGICGTAIREASIEQTQCVASIAAESSADLKLIGVGGASYAEDVHRYLNAGAHAVHLATAPMLNPLVAVEIRERWSRGS